MSGPIFEGEWNVERIFSIFTPNVVLAIFKIKIFPMAQPDKIIWTHEKNWIINVKNTFRMVFEEVQQPNGKSSNTKN